MNIWELKEQLEVSIPQYQFIVHYDVHTFNETIQIKRGNELLFIIVHEENFIFNGQPKLIFKDAYNNILNEIELDEM